MDVTGHHPRSINGQRPEDGERPVDAERPDDERLGIRRREKAEVRERTAPATLLPSASLKCSLLECLP